MSDTDTDTDPVRSLLDALPRHARDQLHVTQTLAGTIQAAVRDHGWTVAQLAQECRRDLSGVANAGALITYRLRHAAGHAPPRRLAPTGHEIVPLCGKCEHGWVYAEDSSATKCECRTPSSTGRATLVDNARATSKKET